MKTLAIRIHQYGAPSKVIQIEEMSLPPIQEDEVLIQVYFSPINPADVNVIQGVYGKNPTLPTILGNEASGIIIEMGKKVTQFQIHDKVVTAGTIGTWSQYIIRKQNKIFSLPPNIDELHASMLHVNPPTAYRMLTDFRKLNSEDWLIQNAANSSVGQSVIEICYQLKINTMNIVRQSNQISHLKKLGANIVETNPENILKLLDTHTQIQKASLALNAVGGNINSLIKILNNNSACITYGAMSRKPLQISNSALIFKNISFHGFWITQWFELSPQPLKQSMMNQIFLWATKGLFKFPVAQCYPLTEAASAIQHACQDGRSGKIVFQCTLD